MSNEIVPAAGPAGTDGQLPLGPFQGPESFAQRVREGLAHAARAGWRELVLSDPDFADWPLGESALVQSLSAWAAPGRQLIILAADFRVFERYHARFVQWRRFYGHLVTARRCQGPGLPEVPSALWTPPWALHRRDVARCIGTATDDARARRVLREAVDECLRQGREAFPATTLGL